MSPEQPCDAVVHCLDRVARQGPPGQGVRSAPDVGAGPTPADELAAPRRTTARSPTSPGSATRRRGHHRGAAAGDVARTSPSSRPRRRSSHHARRASATGRRCGATATATPPGPTAAPIEDMAATAIGLGHEYMVLTDHSARSRSPTASTASASGAARRHRRAQRRHRRAGAVPDPHRDGGRHPRGRRPRPADDLLARLDVVVASVHSKLRMERQEMTERMVLAVASPARRHPRPLHRAHDRQAARVDVRRRLRVRRVRPVPHRGRDQLPAGAARPARGLLDLALDYGCWFSHRHRRPCPRPARVAAPRLRSGRRTGRAVERVINTLSAADLLAWTAE